MAAATRGALAALGGLLGVLLVHSAAVAQQAVPAPDASSNAVSSPVAGPAEPAPSPPQTNTTPPASPYGGSVAGSPPPPPPGAYAGSPAPPYYYRGYPYGGYPPPYPYAYPYPRPYYYGYPPPGPRRLRSVVDRPFSLAAGLGLSGMRYVREDGTTTNSPGGAWDVQIGVGIVPRLQLLFAVDEVIAGDDSYSYQQTAFTGGLELFLGRRLYIRGGAGIGLRSASSDIELGSSRDGLALVAGVGFELVQSYNWGLRLEYVLCSTHFSATRTVGADTWLSQTVNLGFVFY